MNHQRKQFTTPRNRFQDEIDPELAAAIAEQQSIYSSESMDNVKFKQQEKANVRDNKGKRKTVVREAGGKVWEDPTLLEWDPAHFRLYCGNLGGDVNDDSLYRAFSKYLSVVKARVVRDKKTTKSKGFGFVSFKEPDDMLNAWREMNGKYIGSHPVKLSKAETQIKETVLGQAQLERKQQTSAFNTAVVSGRIEKKRKSTFVPRALATAKARRP